MELGCLTTPRLPFNHFKHVGTANSYKSFCFLAPVTFNYSIFFKILLFVIFRQNLDLSDKGGIFYRILTPFGAMDENSKGDAPSQTEAQPDKPVISEAVNQPVTSAPAPDDAPPDAPKV